MGAPMLCREAGGTRTVPSGPLSAGKGQSDNQAARDGCESVSTSQVESSRITIKADAGRVAETYSANGSLRTRSRPFLIKSGHASARQFRRECRQSRKQYISVIRSREQARIAKQDERRPVLLLGGENCSEIEIRRDRMRGMQRRSQADLAVLIPRL